MSACRVCRAKDELARHNAFALAHILKDACPSHQDEAEKYWDKSLQDNEEGEDQAGELLE